MSQLFCETLSFVRNCEFIEALLPILRCCNYLVSNVAIMLWELELCRKLWVYWGATILIARGLLLSSSLGPGSFAFHKVIYSRLQPFTASPLEMTLWNPLFLRHSQPPKQPASLMKFFCLQSFLSHLHWGSERSFLEFQVSAKVFMKGIVQQCWQKWLPRCEVRWGLPNLIYVVRQPDLICGEATALTAIVLTALPTSSSPGGKIAG